MALADGEAEALFAPGQRFTIWADGVVDRTIRPEGSGDSDGTRRKTAGPGAVSRRKADVRPAMPAL